MGIHLLAKREPKVNFVWQQDYNGSQKSQQQFYFVIPICKAVPNVSTKKIDFRVLHLHTWNKKIKSKTILYFVRLPGNYIVSRWQITFWQFQ